MRAGMVLWVLAGSLAITEGGTRHVLAVGPVSAWDAADLPECPVDALDSATGTITQIGRSGVKHAFLTTNVGSGCDTSNGNHVLGRQCGDTYGTGNNDSSSDLGPRSEIIPATGQWGRCGSIYDTNCDGTANASPNGAYDQRMIVKESQITATAGVTWLFESWYLIRDDINIYNTMGTVPWAATFGSSWSSPTGTQSPFRLGPAIDRWVAAGTSTPTARNVELAAPEGHVKVAVQAIDQGGSWRYEYAVMNFDFARAATTGKEDDHTLRVLRNNGFNSFSLPLTAGASVSALQFSDGDVNAANDWTATVLPDRIVWTAPNDASSLNWAAMYRFSFTSNAAPLTAAARLGVTEPGTPSQYEVANLLTLTPGALAVFGPTDATMLEDAASAGRTFTVFDPETLPADINVVASASDPLLFPGGSLAVTGATSDRTLSMSPKVEDPGYRAVSFDEVREAYAEQVRGLIEGGVDLFILETHFDLLAVKAAVMLEDVARTVAFVLDLPNSASIATLPINSTLEESL